MNGANAYLALVWEEWNQRGQSRKNTGELPDVTPQEEQRVLLAGQGPPDPRRIPQGLNFSLDKMGSDRGGLKG